MKLSDWQDEENLPTIYGLYQVEDELYAYYGAKGWGCPAYVGGKEQAVYRQQ